MANFMYILRPTEQTRKTICLSCAKRGEVIDSCSCCHGTAINRKRIRQYYVQDRPIEIEKIDRDPKNGILRYWENKSDFFYETIIPELNKYVLEVPYGVHLCHDTRKSAQIECDRVNKYLRELGKESFETFNPKSFNF